MNDAHGRQADSPAEIPYAGWRDVFWRIYEALLRDRILLIAAGCTFYLLLALFPALTAFVSLYGYVADPTTVSEQIAFLGGVLPAGGLTLIGDQLHALATQPQQALTIGFFFAFVVTFWSANAGIKALFDGLNVAYGEAEKRSFIRLNMVSFAYTVGAMLVAALLLISVGVVPALLGILQLAAVSDLLIRILRWPLLLIVIAAGISLIYRYGPSREPAKWRWITWGGALATLVWLAASIAFSYYLQNFADYNATYGSLGAVIGFMMWTWISVIILLVGAELNAEIEHQTMVDSTTGPAEPMGQRGAYMADTLGAGADKPEASTSPRLDQKSADKLD